MELKEILSKIENLLDKQYNKTLTSKEEKKLKELKKLRDNFGQ